MIKRAQQIQTDVIDGFKGGHGIVEITRFIEGDEMCNKGRFVAQVILKPGASQGYHEHTGEFETFYILEGKAKASDNGTETILGPGDVLVCYDGHGHSLENIGDTDLKVIAVMLNS